MNEVKFGSVCSGIEAASVAWNPLGWDAAWLSEIEPFPSAVLAHHYPDTPNLGDMTKLVQRISFAEVEAPELFCGGTPCQAFSVAGLRKSLDDARGNLSLVFCEVADVIDSVRFVWGEQPAIIFWENVPGVLNTGDNAFGCFLAGLAGEDEALQPAGGKWTNAGCVFGPKRTVAWRVLDAQYFGVAQRRKRVFVVASARTGFNPATILFEFNGLRRDIAPSRSEGQSATPGTTGGTRFGGTEQPYPVANCLTARMHKGINSTLDEGQTPVLTTYAIQGSMIGRQPENGGNAVEPMHNVAPCLTKTDVHGVAHPIPIDMRNAGRDPEKHDAINRQGVGIGEAGDPAHTITSTFVNAVAHPIAFEPLPFDTTQITSPLNGNNPKFGDPCHPLAAKAHVPTIAFHPTQDPISSIDGTTHAMGCGSSGGQASIAVAQPVDFRNLRFHEGDVSGTMQAKSSGGYSLNYMTGVQQKMTVRRLTPTECERLQGFPDGYTAIPWRNKAATDCPDGPRYKALGNSWAVPVVRWIGERINKELGNE